MRTFTSLSQFYTSDDWRGFRAALIAERTNPKDGILYCEECGEPIVKLYECIGHHKQELTMQNVNDYSISLNPDNVMLIHLKCHNAIHARFGFMAQKKVYYVYGAPCSGKSTFVRENKGNSDLLVDIDLIWQAVTGGALYEKPDALRQQYSVCVISYMMLLKHGRETGNVHGCCLANQTQERGKECVRH